RPRPVSPLSFRGREGGPARRPDHRVVRQVGTGIVEVSALAPALAHNPGPSQRGGRAPPRFQRGGVLGRTGAALAPGPTNGRPDPSERGGLAAEAPRPLHARW